jgi:hypothetical protein
MMMKMVRMPGVPAPVSALALGTADFTTAEAAHPVYDDFIEAGGTLFDTAWVYRKGEAEKFFGDWMRKRGLRSSVTLIVKGAHTPECTPEAIGRQLAQSLDRLGVDRADIYMMHRDDPDVPAGEFVDAIAREVAAGRIASYGFSNWELSRVEDAIAHAERLGFPKPTALSNNFSLAEMLEPVWKAASPPILSPGESVSRPGTSAFTRGRARRAASSSEIQPTISRRIRRSRAPGRTKRILSGGGALSSWRRVAEKPPIRWRSPGVCTRRFRSFR